jgi:hypothetical protein
MLAEVDVPFLVQGPAELTEILTSPTLLSRRPPADRERREK